MSSHVDAFFGNKGDTFRVLRDVRFRFAPRFDAELQSDLKDAGRVELRERQEVNGNLVMGDDGEEYLLTHVDTGSRVVECYVPVVDQRGGDPFVEKISLFEDIKSDVNGLLAIRCWHTFFGLMIMLLLGLLLGLHQKGDLQESKYCKKKYQPAPDASAWLADGPYNFSTVNQADTPVNASLMMGLHNSYHQDPAISVFVKSWRYGHPSLKDQLDKGVREIELDVHHEPSSGKFTVYHVRHIDEISSCKCLRDCLDHIATWSKANANHSLIYVWVEPRGYHTRPVSDLWCETEGLRKNRFQQRITDEAITTILKHFDKSQILTPAEVQGNYSNLQDALRIKGWPTNKQTTGKIMFVWNFFGSNKSCRPWYISSKQPKILFARAISDDISVRDNFTAVVEIKATQAMQRGPVQHAGFISRLRLDPALKPETSEELLKRKLKYPGATIFNYDQSPVGASNLRRRRTARKR